MGPDEALRMLLEGNRRFAASEANRPRQSAVRRLEVANRPSPIAVVLSCADSRVPPEIVFDQGLGDLFTVRVAGNVVDDPILASIEFAVQNFGATLVLVLGHERCGAIMGTIAAAESTAPPPGHLDALVRLLQPAVQSARELPGDLVDNTVRLHVQRTVAALKSTPPVLQELVQSGALQVAGGRYDLHSGLVEIIA